MHGAIGYWILIELLVNMSNYCQSQKWCFKPLGFSSLSSTKKTRNLMKSSWSRLVFHGFPFFPLKNYKQNTHDPNDPSPGTVSSRDLPSLTRPSSRTDASWATSRGSRITTPSRCRGATGVGWPWVTRFFGPGWDVTSWRNVMRKWWKLMVKTWKVMGNVWNQWENRYISILYLNQFGGYQEWIYILSSYINPTCCMYGRFAALPTFALKTAQSCR